MMRVKIKYSFILLLLLIMITGCSSANEEKSKTVEPKKDENSVEEVTSDTKEDSTPSSIMANSTVTSEGGQGNVSFKYPGDKPMQVDVKNTGTSTFSFKIEHSIKDIILKQGILKPNEYYSDIFEV